MLKGDWQSGTAIFGIIQYAHNFADNCKANAREGAVRSCPQMWGANERLAGKQWIVCGRRLVFKNIGGSARDVTIMQGPS
jgi:hypothetical protein